MDKIRITFITGRELEIYYNWQKLAPRLVQGGIKIFKPGANMLMPLNSMGICLIELIEPAEVEEPKPEKKESVIVKDTKPEPEVKEAPEKSGEEKRLEALELMKEMSNCPHEEHDIFYQESLTGRAKKPVKRYFPVCRKCGVREKFIKAADLPAEVIEAAQLWKE